MPASTDSWSRGDSGRLFPESERTSVASFISRMPSGISKFVCHGRFGRVSAVKALISRAVPYTNDVHLSTARLTQPWHTRNQNSNPGQPPYLTRSDFLTS